MIPDPLTWMENRYGKSAVDSGANLLGWIFFVAVFLFFAVLVCSAAVALSWALLRWLT